MKRFFFNLKIRNKLLLGFLLITLLFVLGGYRQYFFIQKIEMTQVKMQNSNHIQHAIEKAKLLIYSDLSHSANSVKVNDIESADKIWISHNEVIKKYEQELKEILERTRITNEEDPINPLKEKLNNLSTTLQEEYAAVLPAFEQLNNFKIEILEMPQSPQILDVDISLADSLSTLNQQLINEHRQKLELLKNSLYEQNEYIQNKLLKVLAQLDDAEKVSKKIETSIRLSSQAMLEKTTLVTRLIVIFGALISFLFAIIIALVIQKRITRLNSVIEVLGTGQLPETIVVPYDDEVSKMAKAINILTEGLHRTATFAGEIGKGNFSSQFEALSEFDTLGNTLLEMRKRLKASQEEMEKRQLEDERRSWATQGEARFGEILRDSSKSTTELSATVIKNIIKYLNANQGGLFLYNDTNPDDIHLEMIASFAYNREKHISKKIKLGEGLVGACAIEKNTIHLSEIPEDYLEIESGLGGANPTNILIVPLKMETEIFGVLEIASFHVFRDFEIEFIERIADDITSTLSNVKINARTAQLFEQSQKQAKEMHEQEEKMRYSLEKVQAEQKKSLQIEQNLREKIKELDSAKELLETEKLKNVEEIKLLHAENQEKMLSLLEQTEFNKNILHKSINGIIIFNEDGIIESFNSSAEKIWGYSVNELIGENIKMLFFDAIDETSDKNKQDEVLWHGVSKEIFILRRDGSVTTVFISTVREKLAGKVKYIAFTKDLTQEKENEKKRGELLESIMAKEFKYQTRIEELELLLKEHKIKAPKLLAKKGSLVTWGKEYQLGVNEIDKQHKIWIELINKLYIAFKEGSAQKELNQFFDALIKYTHYHFGFEETYFKRFNYKYRSEHKVVHNEFIEKINHFHTEYVAGNYRVAYDLMNFLRSWVKHHIQVEDYKYVNLFIKNGVK